MNNSLLDTKLKKYFEVNKYTTKQIFEILTWYIYSLHSKQHDLYILAKIIPDSYISELVSYFDGDNLKLPTKEEYKLNKLLIITFFLKEFKHWDWNRIKKFLDFSKEDSSIFNSISLGKKITGIKKELNKDIKNLLNKLDTTLDNTNLDFQIKDFLNG